MVEIKDPEIPSLSVPRILALRDKIREIITSYFLNKILTGDAFVNFVCTIHSAISPKSGKSKIRYDTLTKSLEHIAGVPITAELAKLTAWQIAGNIHHLKKGIVVPAFSRQLFAEWVPAQVLCVERHRKKKWLNKDKTKFTYIDVSDVSMQILAGLAAGQRIHKQYTKGQLYHESTKKLFGFDLYDRRLYDRYYVGNGTFPLTDPRELSTLRVFLLLDPTKSKQGEPAFEKMDTTGTFRKRNRDIMKKRARVFDGFSCIMNYDVNLKPCYECEIGYHQCDAGCHPTTYVIKHCPKCNADKNFLNADATICVDCLAKESIN